MSSAILWSERPVAGRRGVRLWLEFLTLYIGLPLAMATIIPPRHAYPTLGIMTLIGIALLAITSGFSWRSLLPRRFGGHWLVTFAFVVTAAAVITAVCLWRSPYRLFGLPNRATQLWLLILALYPLLSVLPQELLYRSLFFERYGALFGGRWSAMLVNAACFGLGHLFYANAVALALSTLGGLAFAYAYVTRQSFALAVLWHTLAGQLIFTIGLGYFFYHGAIAR